MTDQEPNLPFKPVERLIGNEQFARSGSPIGRSLLGFWQWSGSDLLGNTARGVLAEYIVALDLEIADKVRYGWDAFDLTTKDGIGIEVKSGAYLQTWKQKAYSKLRFGIAPTLKWDPQEDTFSSEPGRWSDVYVFCVLTSKAQDTVDPLDLDQWEFYVLSTAVLDRELPVQKTIGLTKIKQLGAVQVSFGGIQLAVRGSHRRA